MRILNLALFLKHQIWRINCIRSFFIDKFQGNETKNADKLKKNAV